jgi:hypothetical protein
MRMPEPMTGSAVEQTLRSLLEATEALHAAVERDEFDSLADLLRVRERFLAKQMDLVEEWRLRSRDERERDVVRFGPLMEALKQVDKKFSTLCRVKFDATAEQLSQAQNEKLLLAYSR